MDGGMAPEAVPAFYLYGEPQREVREGFVHVESLDDRSRPGEWTIRPHIHRDLNHIILISTGGGSMRVEGERTSFDAPCLLLIPAGMIHGFMWHRESRGWVLTIADGYLRELLDRDTELSPLFRTARAILLPQEDCAAVESGIMRLARELGWSGPGQRAAVESLLLDIMVRAIRGASLSEARAIDSSRQAELVARLRARIEQRFRQRETVAAHACALGVSESGLRLACAQVAASSPAAMLDERALLEARRLLLYSRMGIAEIAYATGFDDPAYFSRFFARHVGQPPRAWRAARRVEGRADAIAAAAAVPSAPARG